VYLHTPEIETLHIPERAHEQGFPIMQETLLGIMLEPLSEIILGVS